MRQFLGSVGRLYYFFFRLFYDSIVFFQILFENISPLVDQFNKEGWFKRFELQISSKSLTLFFF